MSIVNLVTDILGEDYISPKLPFPCALKQIFLLPSYSENGDSRLYLKCRELNSNGHDVLSQKI